MLMVLNRGRRDLIGVGIIRKGEFDCWWLLFFIVTGFC